MNKNAFSSVLLSIAVLCALIAGYYRDKRVDALQAAFLNHCKAEDTAWRTQNSINRGVIDILKDERKK